MSSTEATNEPTRESRTGSEERFLGQTITWLVGALLVLAGLFAGLVGAILFAAADRSWIADLVADGTISSTELTDAQLVDVIHSLLWWGGLGFVLIGAIMLLGGVAFVVYRRRVQRSRIDSGVTGPDTGTNAIAGGLTTILLSFVPFSPVLGGLVAAYLEGSGRSGGARVGAMAGAVAALPLVVLFGVLVVGVAIVAAELSLGGIGIVIGLGLVVGLLGAVVYMVGLGALGGLLGTVLFDSRQASSSDR